MSCALDTIFNKNKNGCEYFVLSMKKLMKNGVFGRVQKNKILRVCQFPIFCTSFPNLHILKITNALLRLFGKLNLSIMY